MPRVKRSFLLLLSLGAIAALLFVAIAPVRGSGTPKTRAADSTRPAKKVQDPAQYVGADNCKVCHEDLFKKFEAAPHYKVILEKRRGVEWQGCEACHGPGAEHGSTADPSKIFSFKGKSTKEISDNCLQCHSYGVETSNFARSAHKLSDVSCLDCHSVHNAKVSQYQLVKAQPDLCYTCHTEVKPEFSRPFRHRVDQKLLKCSDCHNQHGGFLTRGLRATAAQDQVCFTCHADKSGPFVFEHAPVKTEGCMACHVPHGSSNPRMLKRAQVNLLCLECHTLSGDGLAPVGPNHTQSQKYQACTVCHQAIHGSNVDAALFR